MYNDAPPRAMLCARYRRLSMLFACVRHHPAFCVPAKTTPAPGPAHIMGHNSTRLKLCPSVYCGHSLRRPGGGASWVYSTTLPAETIRTIGDWRSLAYLRYISIDTLCTIAHWSNASKTSSMKRTLLSDF